MYTQGEWAIYPSTTYHHDYSIWCEGKYICTVRGNDKANANLIAAAPIGDELATAVLNANFVDYDDFLEMKKLARKFKARANP